VGEGIPGVSGIAPLASAPRTFVSPAPLVLERAAVERAAVERAAVQRRGAGMGEPGEELGIARRRGAPVLPGPEPPGPLARPKTAAATAAAAAAALSTAGDSIPYGRTDVAGQAVQTLQHAQVPSGVAQLLHASAAAPASLSLSREPETVQRVVPAASADSADAGAQAGAGGEATGAHKSDKELDELAGRLYDRFRSRLRMELLVSRERAGMATDLR
jgi:hypothetical protein